MRKILILSLCMLLSTSAPAQCGVNMLLKLRTGAPPLKQPQSEQPYSTLRVCLVLCPRFLLRFLLRTFAIMALRLEGGDRDRDGDERQKRGA